MPATEAATAADGSSHSMTPTHATTATHASTAFKGKGR
jgi:hypothetical protein